MNISPTTQQAKLLKAIKAEASKTAGKVLLCELAEQAGCSPSNATEMIKRLKARGHIIQYKGRIWPIYRGEVYGKRN